MSKLNSVKETGSETHITRFCLDCKYVTDDIAHMIDHLRNVHSYPDTITTKTIKLQETLNRINNESNPIVRASSTLDSAIYELNKREDHLSCKVILDIQKIQKNLLEENKNIHEKYNKKKEKIRRIIHHYLILHTIDRQTYAGSIVPISLMKSVHMNMTSTEIEDILTSLEKDKLISRISGEGWVITESGIKRLGE